MAGVEAGSKKDAGSETMKGTVAATLGAVPVRNRAVRQERRSDEETVLVAPLKERWFMGPPLGWLLPFSRERKVALDRMGMTVWGWCDGKRTTEKVIEEFASRYHVTFHEARVSVLAFLRELTRRGLVALVYSPDDSKKE